MSLFHLKRLVGRFLQHRQYLYLYWPKMVSCCHFGDAPFPHPPNTRQPQASLMKKVLAAHILESIFEKDHKINRKQNLSPHLEYQ